MQLEFVNHASVVLRHGSVKLISDPWFEGTAFDDGWALLTPSVFRYEDFADITHIWISHEHPDHFSPRTLANIAPEHRAQITLLFHASEDRKVVNHCTRLGFAAVQELPRGEWVTLGPEVDLLCDTWEGSDDSWLLVRTPDGTVLNLNDCQTNTQAQADALAAQTGPVDVLLTQFSISAWDGNAQDPERRLDGARSMVNRSVMQARTLQARHVVPFASFIWFCHEDNAYMNSGVAPVGDVVRALHEHTTAQAVVLAPGDRWTLGEPIDITAAVTFYEDALRSIPQRTLHASRRATFDELWQASDRFRKHLMADRSPLRVRLSAVKLNVKYQLRRHRAHPLKARLVALMQLALVRVRPARIWLTDMECSVTFSLQRGMVVSRRPREQCDVALSSGALIYGFRFLWGGETLQINGRFEELYPEGRRPLFDYLWLACAMNRREGAQARPLA